MTRALPLSRGGKGEGSRPLSLLQILVSHSWGGREIIPLQIASRFKSRGWISAVAAPADSPLAKDCGKRGLVFEALDMAFRFDPLAAFRLAGLVDRLRPSILILHFGRDAALWAWASLFVQHRPKTVFCVSVGSGISKKDFYHKWIYGKVDWVTAISRTLYRNVLDTLPVPAKKVNRITWGIEGERFGRRTLGIRPAVRRLGTLARMAPGKGQDDLLRAWARLSPRFPRVELVLAGGAAPGDHAYMSELKLLASRLRRPKSVRFLGHVEDVPEYLKTLDIFVFPSRDEAYGVALVEAMACGLPVAGAAAGGVPEIIRPGRDGLLFAPGNPEGLASILSKLMKNVGLRKRLGLSARARALEKMGLERTVNLYERLYRSLLDGNSQDRCALR